MKSAAKNGAAFPSAELMGSESNDAPINIAIKKINDIVCVVDTRAVIFSYYPNATMLKTSANNATVSQRPTTVMYCEKPFPVSAKASAPAAPALP